MSRQNKVNPGMYTQRGRLTQDDAARELKRQREVGSQHTWQPVQKDQMPRPPVSGDADADRDQETSADNERADATPFVKRPASPARTRKTAANVALAKTRVTPGKQKSSKAAKTATRPGALKPKRKAALARKSGGATKPSAAKRRKS